MTDKHTPDDLRRRLTPLRRAADILTVPARDLEAALDRLPHVKVGRAVLFDIDELRLALLERATADVTARAAEERGGAR